MCTTSDITDPLNLSVLSTKKQIWACGLATYTKYTEKGLAITINDFSRRY